MTPWLRHLAHFGTRAQELLFTEFPLLPLETRHNLSSPLTKLFDGTISMTISIFCIDCWWSCIIFKNTRGFFILNIFFNTFTDDYKHWNYNVSKPQKYLTDTKNYFLSVHLKHISQHATLDQYLKSSNQFFTNDFPRSGLNCYLYMWLAQEPPMKAFVYKIISKRKIILLLLLLFLLPHDCC